MSTKQSKRPASSTIGAPGTRHKNVKPVKKGSGANSFTTGRKVRRAAK